MKMHPLLATMNIILNAVAIDGHSKLYGTREYFFGIDLVNYTEAEQWCSQMNFQLVAIYTEDIQIFLQDTINTLSPGKTIFVDLKLCCFDAIDRFISNVGLQCLIQNTVRITLFSKYYQSKCKRVIEKFEAKTRND